VLLLRFLYMPGKRFIFTQKRKELAAAMLAQKIGYLKLEEFPGISIFDSLPALAFGPHRIIRPKDELFVIREGAVEIWRTHHDMLVSTLRPGILFGDMPLLGQAMLGCKAIAGPEGATLGGLNLDCITEWIKTDPLAILRELGPRLSLVEAGEYRAAFLSVDSKLATLLLELAGNTSSIEGYTHEDLSKRIGAYRETVTNALDELKLDRFIEIGRRRITILDKRALRELSEL
jgi:CRP/FNR family transcriptional regulator, cyclic AMP receptor protein